MKKPGASRLKKKTGCRFSKRLAVIRFRFNRHFQLWHSVWQLPLISGTSRNYRVKKRCHLIGAASQLSRTARHKRMHTHTRGTGPVEALSGCYVKVTRRNMRSAAVQHLSPQSRLFRSRNITLPMVSV